MSLNAVVLPIYYTDKELNRFCTGIDFHREVKPFIIKDARFSGYLTTMELENPDIGLEGDVIYLRDPRDYAIEIKTDLLFSSYI